MSYNALIRQLKDGKEYNALFPAPKGKQVSLGKGDTHTSIKLIIDWALQYNHEVKLVATKLQQGSLSETCFSIHDFLFNHFQYKADGEAQLLRSPARAWKDRYEGIDCKSYSIIASCILLQLGIKHYIRKIKQSAFAPESFTHVYVIVPVNQTSGSLANGYYTIDGTLRSTKEPHYIDKKDFFMDNLKHYGLNGAVTDIALDYIEDFDFKSLLDIDFSSFSAFLASLKCIGGTSYTDVRFDDNVKKILAYHLALVDAYNKSISEGNFKRTGELIAEMFAKNDALDEAFRQNRNKDWNNCTDANLVATRKFLFEKMRDILLVGVFAHFQEFFNHSVISSYVYSQPKIKNDVFDGLKLAHVSTTSQVISLPFSVYSASPKFTEIKAFEITAYMKSQLAVKTSSSTYNTIDYIKHFQQAGTVIYQTTTGQTVDDASQDIYDEQNNTKKPSTAGAGLVFGSLVLIGLATWGFSKMKDTGKGSKTNKN